ncbi:MAG: hypothetical protein RIR10_2075, partial [Planctomycetota bacterium]
RSLLEKLKCVQISSKFRRVKRRSIGEVPREGKSL